MNSPSEADAAASVARKEAVMRRAASVTVYPPHISRTSSRNRGTTVSAPVSNQDISGMLKKSASIVLTSFRGSTYRSVRLASSLAAALLGSLFEHPALHNSFPQFASPSLFHRVLIGEC